MPLDPASTAIGGVQALTGLAQTLFSGRKKAERQLTQTIQNAPKVKANQSILDYYNQALSRYNVAPTESAMYKRAVGDINADTATALSNLGDRRSGLAGASSILRYANKGKLDANVAAEEERNSRFGQLGAATGMKSEEDKYVFNQNEMLPFELKTQMYGQKLQGANQRTNAGMQNIFGGFSTIGSGYTKKTK